MREVYFVKKDERSKAEDVLKKDDVVSRQSIAVREANALGIDEDGYFIILDGSESALRRADELLNGLAERYEKKDDVLKRFDETEDSVVSGVGFVLGD